MSLVLKLSREIFRRISKVSVRVLFHCAAFGVAAFVIGGFCVTAANASSPGFRLHTHEAYVEDVLQRNHLPSDPLRLFADILNTLPARVRIYPTENYYYFHFFSEGVRYAGNIRLGAGDRDQGKVHFNCYEDASPWHEAGALTSAVFDRSNGVLVERLGPLAYRVKYRTKSVVFVLNDLSQVRPPAGTLNDDEVFVGPIFDESAVSFFLIFNRSLKQFFYILNETNLPEKLVRSPTSERILIGQRTGFAFYRDDKLQRKILIGVFAENADINNYFDGPFDQLPDNFIKGDELGDFIVLASPELKGKIDRFGIFSDGDRRYAIAPYLAYKKMEDLDIFATCAESSNVPPAQYYNCFVIDDDSRSSTATPLALTPQR